MSSLFTAKKHVEYFWPNMIEAVKFMAIHIPTFVLLKCGLQEFFGVWVFDVVKYVLYNISLFVESLPSYIRWIHELLYVYVKL